MARRSAAQDVLLAVAVLAAYWLFGGYRYFVNSGIEMVPLIHRYINHDYLANDYYLNLVANTVNHRYVFIRLIAWPAEIIGSVQWAMLIWYVLAYFALFVALIHLARTFVRTPVARLITVTFSAFFIYLIVTRLTVGYLALMPNEMVANLIVRVGMMWGVVLAMRGNLSGTMATLLACAFIQAPEALLAFPTLAAIAVFAIDEKQRRTAILRVALWFIPLVIVVLGLSWDALGRSPSNAAIVAAAIDARLGHHYLPSHWSLLSWIFTAGLATAGTYSLNRRKLMPLTIGSGIAVVLFVGYVIVLLITGSSLLLSLEGAKVLIIPYFLWTLTLTADAVEAISDRATRAGLNAGHLTAAAAFAAIVCAGLTLAVRPIFPRPAAMLLQQAKYILGGNYRTAADYVGPAEADMYAWLRQHTGRNDVILHPPTLQMIRPLAQRSSVVQLKLIGFTPQAMREWLQRMRQLEHYCRQSAQSLLRAAAQYHASWIVVHNGCAAATQLDIVYHNSQWSVARVPLAPPGHRS